MSLQWEDVTPVATTKAFGDVKVGISLKKDTCRMFISFKAELIREIRWKDVKAVKLQTAADGNKRMLRVSPCPADAAKAIKLSAKMKDSAIIYLNDQPWAPRQALEKKDCFHRIEDTAADVIALIIEMPRDFNIDTVAEVNAVSQPPSGSSSGSRLNGNGQAPLKDTSPKEDSRRAAADEIVRDDMRAILGKCKLIVLDPEINIKTGELLTGKGKIKLATAWANVMQELLRTQTVSGKLLTMDELNSLSLKYSPNEKKSNAVLIGALNTAYLNNVGLKLFSQGKYVALTAAD